MNNDNKNKNHVWLVMEAAIECNNNGAALLHEGRLEEALLSFKEAAKIMHPVSQYFHLVRINNDAPSPHISSLQTFEQVKLDDDRLSFEAGRRRRDDKAKPKTTTTSPPTGSNCARCCTRREMDKENNFILCEPICIDSLHDVPTSCTVESAIIVFNMGLVYRLQGPNESLLTRAWSLFDMAFSLIYSIPSVEARTSRIGMACLNNAGEAQHCLGNYELSRRYLDTLYAIVVSLPPPNDDDTFKERHQLLLNVMLLREPKVAGAA